MPARLAFPVSIAFPLAVIGGNLTASLLGFLSSRFRRVYGTAGGGSHNTVERGLEGHKLAAAGQVDRVVELSCPAPNDHSLNSLCESYHIADKWPFAIL
jgi:hypothetical protein